MITKNQNLINQKIPFNQTFYFEKMIVDNFYLSTIESELTNLVVNNLNNHFFFFISE